MIVFRIILDQTYNLTEVENTPKYLFSLNIFIVENAHYKHSNNTVTQSYRIRTKAGSLYSSSPDHE